MARLPKELRKTLQRLVEFEIDYIIMRDMNVSHGENVDWTPALRQSHINVIIEANKALGPDRIEP